MSALASVSTAILVALLPQAIAGVCQARADDPDLSDHWCAVLMEVLAELQRRQGTDAAARQALAQFILTWHQVAATVH
jgi:TorA maturation chaperone TorD